MVRRGMLRVPVLLLLGGHALGERPNKAAPLASSSSRPVAPASDALPEVSTSELANELLKEIAEQSGRQWPSGLPETSAEKPDEKKAPEKKENQLKKAAEAKEAAKAAQEEKVTTTEPKQQREQDEVMNKMLASATKAQHFAKQAKVLNAQEFSQRQQLEEATNESKQANETFERALEDYETAANRSQTLGTQLLEAKKAMIEASQLAGTTQEELDGILQQWAASNATASETLGLLQAAQRSFADANRTLVSAQLALEKAKKEEAEAKKKTVDEAERVLQAVNSQPKAKDG